MLFTSGANAGASTTVKQHTFANGANTFAPMTPLNSTPAGGDNFTVFPGYDKTMATCRTKFNNLTRIPRRVRHRAATRSARVPEVPAVAARTDAAPTNPEPAAGQQANAATREKLAEDAAQTTLMVVEFQRWYREQAEASGQTGR